MNQITIKGSSKDFLDQCLAQGLLTEEAARRADQVLAENAALRRENAILKGRLAELRKLNKAYRADHLEALKYKFDAEEGWRYTAGHRRQMMLAVAGLSIALTCLACSLALCV